MSAWVDNKINQNEVKEVTLHLIDLIGQACTPGLHSLGLRCVAVSKNGPTR